MFLSAIQPQLTYRPNTIVYPSGLLTDDSQRSMDLGGLEIEFLPTRRFQRRVRRHQAAEASTWLEQAQDDLSQRGPSKPHDLAKMNEERREMLRMKEAMDLEKANSPCQPVEWTLDSFPSCNTIHEVALLDRIFPDDYAIKQLGQGGTFRLGFLYSRQSTTNDNASTNKNQDEGQPYYINDFVLKVIQMAELEGRSDIILGRTMTERINEEALLLNHLTYSDLVSNIYGYCGTTVAVERGQDLSHQIVPYLNGQVDDDMRGYISMEEMDKLHEANAGLYQGNKFSPEQKLDIAIAIMESIALLHGFDAGPIAHNDISFDQWLLSMDGRVILNDFNSAVPLTWNDQNGRYCKHTEESGNYKSPESFVVPMFLDEKADVWPLGCILYGILAGVMPYHEYTSEADYTKKTLHGIPPHLHPAFRDQQKTSFIERGMAKTMDQMFTVAMEERPSIHVVVAQLHDIRKTHLERKRFGSGANHHRRLHGRNNHGREE
jgi:Protein kinase domain